MRKALDTLVNDFGWIYSGIGLVGNFSFLCGSILFLPQFEPWKVAGVWLFITGAALMLVRAVGDLLVKLFEREDN